MSGIVLLIVSLFVLGMVLVSLSSYLSATRTGNTKVAWQRFALTMAIAAGAAYLCWWSYQPYSGVLAPNVFRAVILLIFVMFSLGVAKRNIFPKKRELNFATA